MQIAIMENGFSLTNLTNEPVGFAGDTQAAIIRLTTLSQSPIFNVQPIGGDGFDLLPGALTFDDEFFQVDLLKTHIGPNGTFSFSVALFTDSVPVPLPASLPLFASGLVALASVRFFSRGGRIQ
jgi:hypothetical protein